MCTHKLNTPKITSMSTLYTCRNKCTKCNNICTSKYSKMHKTATALMMVLLCISTLAGANRPHHRNYGIQKTPTGRSLRHSGLSNFVTDNGDPHQGYQVSKIFLKKNINSFIIKSETPAINYLPKNQYPSSNAGWVPYYTKDRHQYKENYLSYGGSYLQHSSPNDVINNSLVLQPWDATHWDYPLDPDVCRSLAGLTRPQLHLCRKYTDVAGAAAIGLAIAVSECRRLLAHQRWNCTALITNSNNPHTALVMSKGYSESGFAHAITAAGVTHSVARACAAGRLSMCSCGEVRGRQSWKWEGCHDNTRFGAKYSRMFLDVRERARDIISFTHLYNNEVGRKVVRRNRKVQCKCHGMSGSCEMQTCWKATPEFTTVGEILVKKYRKAQSADSAVLGNNANQARKFKPSRREITPTSPLLYAESSPNYCKAEQRLGVPGTLGRRCNRTSTGPDSCRTLCCGRGYDVVKRKISKKCNCRFKWCCHVTCQDCAEEKWITVCK